MFSNNAYVKIWKIEKGNGNYFTAQMSTSTKNMGGEYEKDWSDGRVRLVGNAAKQAEKISAGDTRQIASCGVTNRYDKDKKITYTNYTIFSFVDDNTQNSKQQGKTTTQKKSNDFINVPDSSTDEELPFA